MINNRVFSNWIRLGDDSLYRYCPLQFVINNKYFYLQRCW